MLLRLPVDRVTDAEVKYQKSALHPKECALLSCASQNFPTELYQLY